MTRAIGTMWRRPPPQLLPARSDRTQPGGPSPEVLAAARAGAPGEVTLAGMTGKPQPGAARLVVIAGPRKGAECVLIEDVTTIGRAGDNAFVLPDISVSRQHSRIEREGKRWVLVDQGSGNGTRLEGRPVQRRRLRDGDRLEMGDTVVQFVSPGGVAAGGSAVATDGRRRRLVAGAVAVALLTVAAAGLAGHEQRLRAQAALRAQREETRALARRRLEQARLLLAAGNPAEALSHLRVAAELDADAEIARTLAAVEAQEPPPARAPSTPALPPPRADRTLRRPRPRRPADPAARMVIAPVTLERRSAGARELDFAVAASDEDLPRAASHARAAVAADPGNAAARKRLDELSARIHDVYLRAYVVREDDREEARKAFRLVIDASPAADETAQKAKRWLDKLEGKAAE